LWHRSPPGQPLHFQAPLRVAADQHIILMQALFLQQHLRCSAIAAVLGSVDSNFRLHVGSDPERRPRKPYFLLLVFFEVTSGRLASVQAARPPFSP
jgi:hypothetical protein